MKKYFYLTVVFLTVSVSSFSVASAADVQLMGTDVYDANSNGAEYHTYSQYTASTTGVVNYVTQYSTTETPAASTVWLGVYSDLNDTPYQLLGFGSSSYSIPQNSVKSVSITPVALFAGTKYWVSAISNTGEGTHIDSDGTSRLNYLASSSATFSFPETATTSGYAFVTSTLYLYGVFGEATENPIIPPTISSLSQFKSDGLTPVSEGATVTEDTIVFSARLESFSTNLLRLEVEHTDSSFSGVSNATSISVSPGSFAVVTVSSLQDGIYWWRARAVDVSTGFASAWAEFGIPGNPDFVVNAPGQTASLINTFSGSVAGQFTGLGVGISAGAYSFTPDKSYALSRIETDFPGGPEFFLTLRDGLDGTILATSTASIPFSGGAKKWEFLGGVILDTGTTYYLKTEGSFDSDRVKRMQGSGSPWSPGGAVYGKRSDNNNWISFNQNFLSGGGAAVFYGFASASPIKVAVILAEPYGVSFSPAHTKAYYESQIIQDLKDYWCEVSFGTRDQSQVCENGLVMLEVFSSDIHDRGGQYYQLPSSTADYAKDEREFVGQAITATGQDFSSFDIVAVVHAGSSSQVSASPLHMTTKTWSHNTQPQGSPPFKFIVAEDELLGVWAHEIGHIVGELFIDTPDSTVLPDLYKIGLGGIAGNFVQTADLRWRWDLMAFGSNNGDPRGSNPSSLGSYSKEFLNWLHYDIKPKSAYGSYWVNSVETSNLDDAILRYNLVDDASAAVQKYYILEARNRNLMRWSSSTPEEKALVVYYADDRGADKYGYVGATNELNVQGRRVTIMQNGVSIPAFGPINDGILSPNGEAYYDFLNLVSFEATTDRTQSGKYEIQADIQPIDVDSFPTAFRATFLEPSNDFSASIQSGELATSPPRGPSIYFVKARVSNIISDTSTASLVEAEMLFSKPILVEGLLPPDTGSTFSVMVSNPTLAKSNVSVGDVIYARIAVRGGIRLADDIIFKIHPTLVFYFYAIILLLVGSAIVYLAVRVIRSSRTVERKIMCFIGIVPLVLIILVLSGSAYYAIANNWEYEYVVSLNFKPLGDYVQGIRYQREYQQRTKLNQGPINSLSPPSISAPLFPQILPDLDLHAMTPGGLHVGVNYTTGEYESQVAGTIASGDNQGAPEWILLPDGTDAKFYVSSRDNQDFLSANPDIASQLATTTDSYELFARYIDPNSGIFTSEILQNETISPGSTTTYAIHGTSTPEVIKEIALTPTADSYLKKGSPNQNFGSESILNVRGDGKRRTLVQFDQLAIANAVGSSTLISATIELDIIAGSAQNWTSEGRIVGAHRLTHSWTESGVTWNCSDDTDTSNGSPDCSGDTWQMEENDSPSWIATPTDDKLITNGLSGALRYDVTPDVQAFLTGTQNYGWILRKAVDTQSGDVEFGSREAIKQPKLILKIQ